MSERYRQTRAVVRSRVDPRRRRHLQAARFAVLGVTHEHRGDDHIAARLRPVTALEPGVVVRLLRAHTAVGVPQPGLHRFWTHPTRRVPQTVYGRDDLS